MYTLKPQKTDRGVQLYLDGTDDQVVSLSDPQGLQGVEVVDLVHIYIYDSLLSHIGAW